MRKGIRRIVIWSSIIALILAICDLGVYFSRFAYGHRWLLSQDSEDWARFGEYVGGTLGPAFALLAFGAALFAISEQSQQASIEEIERLMIGMYDGINRLLNSKPPKLDTLAAQQLKDVQSLGELLAVLFRKSIFSSADAQEISALVVDVASDCIRREASAVEVELVHFVVLLNEYQRQGGTDAVIRFYRERYREVVCGLHLANRLNSVYVREFFDPVRSIDAARRAVSREGG